MLKALISTFQKTRSLEFIRRLRFVCKSWKTLASQESKSYSKIRRDKASSLRTIPSSNSSKAPKSWEIWSCLQVVNFQLIVWSRWLLGRTLGLTRVWARLNRNWRWLMIVGPNPCGNTKRNIEIVIPLLMPTTTLLAIISKKDSNFLPTKLGRNPLLLLLGHSRAVNWESVLCAQSEKTRLNGET